MSVCSLVEITKRGFSDGVGAEALFDSPDGITVDTVTGNIYVSDSDNNAVRVVTPSGSVTTLVGGSQGNVEGKAEKAKFYHPKGICFDPVDRVLLLCDQRNQRVRQITLEGESSTLFEIMHPKAIAITPDRNILVAANIQYKIFLAIRRDGGKFSLKPIAGTGKPGADDGEAFESTFNWPQAIAVHEQSQSILIADWQNCRIRRLSFN